MVMMISRRDLTIEPSKDRKLAKKMKKVRRKKMMMLMGDRQAECLLGGRTKIQLRLKNL